MPKSAAALKPIKTDKDHVRALQEMHGLWDARKGSPQHDRLEILGALVAAYEDKRWPIDLPDPVAAIEFRMEQAGYGQSDLAKLVGSRSRASEILNRRRPLSMAMVWRLHKDWQIPAELLVKPYRLKQAA